MAEKLLSKLQRKDGHIIILTYERRKMRIFLFLFAFGSAKIFKIYSERL